MKTRMINRLLFLIFFSLAVLPAEGLQAEEVLRFQYQQGQRFHIEGTVEEEVYRNDVLIETVTMKNIGELTVTRVEGNRALHEGVFSYYRESEHGGGFVLEQEYPTRFYRDVYGKYQIEDRYYMPVVRGVPTFPEGPVEIGDQWTSKATEAHDFRPVFGIENPVILPAAVSYQYLGNTVADGFRIARLSINYVINYTLRYSGYSSRLLPVRAVGYFNQLYYWNLDRGAPHSYRENFDYIFILSNGEVLEYRGSSRAVLRTTVELSESEREIEGIRTRLRESIPSVEVERTTQGILINTGEILFRFDSAELTETADSDLDNIVEVLKDFPGRRIRVAGHTDSTGPEEYNRSLSVRRARRVAEELEDRLPALGDNLTYIGMGESSPIADNSTERGRQRNRRVEIIILDE
jgi:outer membrane protein OmpA-like peptidoglycan-associated protein